VAVVLLILAGAAGLYFDAWDRFQDWRRPDPQTEPAAVPPPAGLELPEHAVPGPVVATVPAARSGDVAPHKVGRALAAGLRDRDLGRHVVARVGDLSGTGPDWSNGEQVFTPASTTKLLTAAAALEALGPDHRFTTRVVAGGKARRIVLVGGGDPYLASKPLTPEEARTTYPERADVVTLARRTARELVEQQGRRPTVRLSYDDSLFSGPVDNPAWRRDYVPDDIVSPITALWVDSGNDPSGFGNADDPSRVAAETFARALARQGVTVVGAPRPGTAAPDASEIASVEGAPLADVVEHLLDVSDNEAAEVVAHHVGVAVDGDGSFAGGARAVLATLDELGVPTRGAVLRDGSGLSRHNRLSAETMLATLRLAALPGQPDLRAVISGLPVAGFTGSLTYRFADGEPAGRGAVRAKTGTLTGVHGLAGLVTDRQGNTMVFVLAADRVKVPDTLDARQTLDQLAAELAACRCGA
jgi:D-alanyl-D-alanine carboxypeptidase/D-alanyl-D-alanine-endopeptidase (penicillin-binding protein 4)